MAEMLQDLVKTASKYCVKLNWDPKETKVMDLRGRRRNAVRAGANGEIREVPVAMEAEYLGRYFSAGGGGDEAVERRIQKAWGALWANGLALCNFSVPFGKRFRHLSQTVGAVLTYGLESVELTKTQLERLRGVRRSMMRKMWGLRWEAVSTEMVYEDWIRMTTSRMEDEVEWMGEAARWEEAAAARKFRWAGHLVRRGTERRTKRILVATERSTRAKRGKPKQRWKDTMEGLVGVGWQQTAENREWWQFFGREVPGWID